VDGLTQVGAGASVVACEQRLQNPGAIGGVAGSAAQIGEQFQALADAKTGLDAVDDQGMASELGDRHGRHARRDLDVRSPGGEHPADRVPRGVRLGLGVDTTRGDGGELGEDLERYVVGTLAGRCLQGQVGGPVGRVLVAGAPFRLRQQHPDDGQFQEETAGLQERRGLAQAVECVGVGTAAQQQPVGTRRRIGIGTEGIS
jgi:hypothetical protein